jgi:FAD/FMN-containing dehydrogenase
LRGGGGNFGVVVSFLFRAHPVSQVYAGPVFWDLADARTVMSAYRDFLPGAPDSLGLFFGLKTVPMVDPFPAEHQGKRVCALIACHNDQEADGAAAMAPLMDRLPAPLFDWRSMMPFPGLQTLFDGLLPKGLNWYWRGDFVDTLPDDAIEAHLEHAARLGPGDASLMHLYPIDGAVHRVGPQETAWHTRSSTWNMVIAGIDQDLARYQDAASWAKEYWSAVHPWSSAGGYVNFMMDDTTVDRLRATFGENYDRLASVKAVYDPTNTFRSTQNIPPDATSLLAG